MRTGNASFDKGFEEGKIIGFLEVIIHMLDINNGGKVEKWMRDGLISEFQKQQALFYIRMGICGDSFNKRKGE